MNQVILLAAGSSKRAGQNKLWAEVFGEPLWTHSLETFQNHKLIDAIVLVVKKSELNKFSKYAKKYTKLQTIVAGGKTRAESFVRGLQATDWGKADLIIDHNTANPNVTLREITDVINNAKKYGAAAVSLPCVDTVISCNGIFYEKTFDRSRLRLMQTPQAVRGDILKQIKPAQLQKKSTDLSSILLKKFRIKVVESGRLNRKITFKEDLEALAAHSYIGEDSHKFSKGGQLVLGGIEVAEYPKLEANSDGDVVLHAIGRALAQALNQSFSKISDKICDKGTKDSRKFLEPLLKELNVLNISISIECKFPKIDKLPIVESLSKILKVEKEKIHISAHSGEGLGPFGEGKGVKCVSIVQCKKK